MAPRKSQARRAFGQAGRKRLRRLTVLIAGGGKAYVYEEVGGKAKLKPGASRRMPATP
jgi:hypothetical protein